MFWFHWWMFGFMRLRSWKSEFTSLHPLCCMFPKCSPQNKCGGNIEIDVADYLTSPGYPGAYPPSQACVWVITAPEPGQKILINFNPHFDLEDRDCKRTEIRGLGLRSQSGAAPDRAPSHVHVGNRAADKAELRRLTSAPIPDGCVFQSHGGHSKQGKPECAAVPEQLARGLLPREAEAGAFWLITTVLESVNLSGVREPETQRQRSPGETLGSVGFGVSEDTCRKRGEETRDEVRGAQTDSERQKPSGGSATHSHSRPSRRREEVWTERRVTEGLFPSRVSQVQTEAFGFPDSFSGVCFKCKVQDVERQVSQGKGSTRYNF
ncbi:unnamed protein product [Pleuronectes platessa]|uniref:CUB domain-containing protein n=1 Tax=Pleuronectes platessa TaxID=8262 RepID=A0A9N7YFL4_PLEPL|nr:unnamed protein product [Pleuronectes platessa]